MQKTSWRYRRTIFLLAVFVLLGFSAEGIPQTRIGKTFEEIEKLAAQEGKVYMASSLGSRDAKAVLKGFRQKYPMIQVEHTRVSGARKAERVLNEAMSGLAEFDLYDVPGAMVKTFVERRVIAPIEWQRIFPKIPKVHLSTDGHFNALGFNLRAMAYNPSLVPKERIPKDWSDCLDPYWKGKLAVDSTPRSFVALYNAWGEEKILQYVSKLKDNEPIWVSGQTRSITQLAAGEFPMLCGAHSATIFRVLRRDPKANVAIAIPKEVPVALSLNLGLMKAAQNPNAGLLLGGWLSSPGEGQEAIGRLGRGSPYIDGGITWKLIKEAGAKPVFQGWDRAAHEPMLTPKILSAWGFPVAK